MRNRFQLNEQEKGRIRALHGIQVISEASTLENLGKSMADNPKQWNELPKDWKELFTLLGYTEKTYNEWINDLDFDNIDIISFYYKYLFIRISLQHLNPCYKFSL